MAMQAAPVTHSGPAARCPDAHRAKRRRLAASASSDGHKQVTLLDYGAGNVRSVRNALKRLGYEVRDVSTRDLYSSALSTGVS